ncbi:hypothetical protein DM860_005229 [Cuscuta australis]|uniref:NAC domain-containing protein n=1 Tax=Cuscuta australis TaxID=267555 RepID=A0A328E343_9ASTE|nr:hypothetical protein DM860_005229 [Cuscuta australis]
METSFEAQRELLLDSPPPPQQQPEEDDDDDDEEELCCLLPPGFRFHPTDEEIILHYLRPKVADSDFVARAIGEADLNKCEPWDLPRKSKMGDKEWWFFCRRDRKYPTGMRTNRATESGYWKATGKDKEIFTGRGSSSNYNNNNLVGMKKTLVFYMGRAPKGQKSNWIMHEFRLEGRFSFNHSSNTSSSTSREDWVVCRVFHKVTAAVAGIQTENKNGRIDSFVDNLIVPHTPTNSSTTTTLPPPPLTDYEYYYSPTVPAGAEPPTTTAAAAAQYDVLNNNNNNAHYHQDLKPMGTGYPPKMLKNYHAYPYDESDFIFLHPPPEQVPAEIETPAKEKLDGGAGSRQRPSFDEDPLDSGDHPAGYRHNTNNYVAMDGGALDHYSIWDY